MMKPKKLNPSCREVGNLENLSGEDDLFPFKHSSIYLGLLLVDLHSQTMPSSPPPPFSRCSAGTSGIHQVRPGLEHGGGQHKEPHWGRPDFMETIRFHPAKKKSAYQPKYGDFSNLNWEEETWGFTRKQTNFGNQELG